jgi:uncharacterized membrane protein YidH (DUF202 family)
MVQSIDIGTLEGQYAPPPAVEMVAVDLLRRLDRQIKPDLGSDSNRPDNWSLTMKAILLALSILLMTDLALLGFERWRRTVEQLRELRQSERKSESHWLVAKCCLVTLSILVIISSITHLILEAYKTAGEMLG